MVKLPDTRSIFADFDVTQAQSDRAGVLGGLDVTPGLPDTTSIVAGLDITPALPDTAGPLAGLDVTPGLPDTTSIVAGLDITPALPDTAGPLAGLDVTPGLPDTTSIVAGLDITPGLPDTTSIVAGLDITPGLPDTTSIVAGLDITPGLPDTTGVLAGLDVTPGLPDAKSFLAGLDITPALPDTTGVLAGLDVTPGLPDAKSFLAGLDITPALPDTTGVLAGLDVTPGLPDAKSFLAGLDITPALPDTTGVLAGLDVTPGLPDAKSFLAGVKVPLDLPDTKRWLEIHQVTAATLGGNELFEAANPTRGPIAPVGDAWDASGILDSILGGANAGIFPADLESTPSSERISVYAPSTFRSNLDVRANIASGLLSIECDSVCPAPDLISWIMFRDLERRLRFLVREQLHRLAGDKWLKQRVPFDVRQRWHARQDEDRAAHRQVHGEIEYADFMDLCQVIVRKDNWRDAFEAIFQNKEDINVSFYRLHPVRKALGHSRQLSKLDVLTLFAETSRIVDKLKARRLR